jgi:hypothetical protein
MLGVLSARISKEDSFKWIVGNKSFTQNQWWYWNCSSKHLHMQKCIKSTVFSHCNAHEFT